MVDTNLANKDDCTEILELQKLAYKQEAQLYNDFTIPPLTQTIEDLIKEFDQSTVLKAVIDNKVVGSVRACLKNDTCFIGRLIVHPDFQNKGIGKELLNRIEKLKEAGRYELFTGEKSIKNIHLYQKLGYKIYKKEKLNNKVNIVYLEKIIDRDDI